MVLSCFGDCVLDFFVGSGMMGVVVLVFGCEVVFVDDNFEVVRIMMVWMLYVEVCVVGF